MTTTMVKKPEWIEKLPNGWAFLPVRAILKERKEKNSELKEGNILSVMKGIGVIRYEDKGNVGNKSSERPEAYKIVRKNDLVLNSMNLSIGSVGMAREDGVTSSVYIIYQARPKIADPDFYHYLFQTTSFQRHLASYGRGIMELREAVKERDIRNQPVVVPPLETQKRIADFLDEKTRVVDELVAKKEKLIELLCEKRAALITRAVTKGLDPNAKLKPSGIDWLGDIPEEWNTKPFASLFRERSVSNGSGDVQNVLSLSYGKIVDRDVETNFGLLPASFNTYQIVEPGWIVFRLTDLQNDHKSLRTGLVTKRGIITSAYLSVEPTSEINQSYASFLLHSYDLYKVFYSMGGGVRQTIGYAELKWMPVVLPPLEVQNNLVKFLDAETGRIDKAVVLIESQIEKLKEYRSSLIYHAVTGKIKI